VAASVAPARLADGPHRVPRAAASHGGGPAEALASDIDAPPADEPAPTGPATPWLDEVRAQRHAWEERRQTTRNAFEARRRLADPRAAAYREAREEDVRRRREARMQRMEQDREFFRGLSQPPRPWHESQDPLSATPPRDSKETPDHLTETRAPATEGQSAGTIVSPPAATLHTPYSPATWDNLWYYRGY
jgi:hypothetical protein